MKKLWMLSLCLLTIGAMGMKKASAQDYNLAVSATLGASFGVDVKKFITPRSALNAGFDYNMRSKAPMFAVTYQYHVPVVDAFTAYFGGGVNIGATSAKKHFESEFAFGLHPNVGIEYKFNAAPIALAIDYKPYLNFTTHSQSNNVTLKVRYTF